MSTALRGISRRYGEFVAVGAERLIGPIVRLELRAEGRAPHEPLEAEISRERFEAQRFREGEAVSLRFRRWQIDPAAALTGTGDAVV